MVLSFVCHQFYYWVPIPFTFFCRFKFDDERVTKEDMKRVLEEQYGGEEEVLLYIFSELNLFVLILKFNALISFPRLSLSIPDSYPRPIPVSIMPHLSLQNTPMHTCLCIYVKVTRRK